MRSHRIHGWSNIACFVAAALLATAPASTARAADGEDFARTGGECHTVGGRLQLGVGQSCVYNLSEDAEEIYVGDPKVANAIVRTARRIYISGQTNGQTSILALARGEDRHTIAAIQVSVGRATSELKAILNAAIPGNDITVRTVEDSVILTGSVASAAEAQKAVDIASGFVNFVPSSCNGTTSSPVSVSVGASGGSGGSSGGSGGASGSSSSGCGKLINSLTIRGLDQVSLRVTVAEFGVTSSSSWAST